jgi:ATP-dependent DNA ligase
VRLYSRNAYDWTARLAAIAAAAELIKARSFTIDSEAVVLGPDGLLLVPGATAGLAQSFAPST